MNDMDELTAKEGFLGCEVDDYLSVLVEAHRIYQARSLVRGDMWKNQGWRGQLFNMKTCVERAWRKWWGQSEPKASGWPPGEPNIDDMLDLINYTVFAIILIREGDRDGTWEYPQ